MDPKPEIIFVNQPTYYIPRDEGTLRKKNHGHIAGDKGSKSFPKIQVKNGNSSKFGKLWLSVKPCYAEKLTLSHHYRLVRHDRKEKSSLESNMDPLFYELSKKNHYTTELKIVVMSPSDKYKRINTKPGKKMVLFCELFSSFKKPVNGDKPIATKTSDPIENKRNKLKTIKVVGEGSVDGGTKIYLPNIQDPNVLYKIKFSKGLQFEEFGEIINTSSDSICVKTPPYKIKNITEAVTVSVRIVEKGDIRISDEYQFKYMPREYENLNFQLEQILSSVGTSQDDCITILRMTPINFVNDKAEVWLCCTPISKSVEYVNKYITVRFSNENFEDNVKIKQFIPNQLLIIEISKDFYKKYESNATIKIIDNAFCASENVLPVINDGPEILPELINDAKVDQVFPELSGFPYIPTVLAENLLEMFDN